MSKINKKNKIIQMQIESNQPLADKVKFYDDQIFKLERNIALVDSFSKNYDETYNFMELLNQGILKARDVWIEDLKIVGRKVELNGYANRREIIPILSEALGGANLKRVTRATLHEKRVFNFVLDKKIGTQQDTQNLQLLTGLTKAKQKTQETNGSSGTNGHSKKEKNN